MAGYSYNCKQDKVLEWSGPLPCVRADDALVILNPTMLCIVGICVPSIAIPTKLATLRRRYFIPWLEDLLLLVIA